jgi:hypothetical protein
VSGFRKLFGKLFGSCEAGTLYRTGTFTGSEIFGLSDSNQTVIGIVNGLVVGLVIVLVMGLVVWLVR